MATASRQSAPNSTYLRVLDFKRLVGRLTCHESEPQDMGQRAKATTVHYTEQESASSELVTVCGLKCFSLRSFACSWRPLRLKQTAKPQRSQRQNCISMLSSESRLGLSVGEPPACILTWSRDTGLCRNFPFPRIVTWAERMGPAAFRQAREKGRRKGI